MSDDEQRAPTIPAPAKQCGCGQAYSLEQWLKLAWGGHMLGLELRHCDCESTIAVELAEVA